LDVKAYISSGILESYVLGLSNEAENAEVEALLKSEPSIAKEVANIRATMEEYALLHAINPTAQLKDKTRAAIFGNKEDIQAQRLGTISAEAPTNSFRWNMAASWALLALSIFGNYYLFQKWQNTESVLNTTLAQNAQLAKNEAIQKANYQGQLAAIQDSNYKKVSLAGTKDSPNAKATVYFNSKNNEVYLTAMAMPILPAGKQYQLWAIIDGKPVDAGLISTTDSLGKMKLSQNAVAFAISIEDTGGSTTEAGPKGAVLAMGGV
jgi:anti-sigma-K factor RskA